MKCTLSLCKDSDQYGHPQNQSSLISSSSAKLTESYWAHVSFEPYHEKTCLCHMRTTKVQISAFIVCCLDSTIPLVSISKISKSLVSFCGCADRFESFLVANPEDRFSRDGAHFVDFAVPWLILLVISPLWVQASLRSHVRDKPSSACGCSDGFSRGSPVFAPPNNWQLKMSEIILTGHKTQIKKKSNLVSAWSWLEMLPSARLTYNLSRRATKTTKWSVCPAKPQIRLSICPVWSESSLSTWRSIGSLAIHKVHSEDWSDWADSQADLSLCWAHSSYCLFCHAQAHLRFDSSTTQKMRMVYVRGWYSRCLNQARVMLPYHQKIL